MPDRKISAVQALERLCEGNRRFAAGTAVRRAADEHMRRVRTLADQAPYAIVLGCSDSRVPAEMVFDQGLGDLFVIRVAGNIVAPSQVGSIEFAAERFSVRLVVVLGHSGCGAVAASLEQPGGPGEPDSPGLGFIVRSVREALAPLQGPGGESDQQGLMKRAVRENVRYSVRRLRQGSAVLERLIAENGLRIVGAEYELKTGEVDFFDGVPLESPSGSAPG